MSDFKVGDRVRYIEDGDEGPVASIRGVWIDVNFDRDGLCAMLESDLELVSVNSAEPKSFEESVSEFSPAVSQEEIMSMAEIAEQFGISTFEQNVRRITDQIADLLIAKNKQYSNSALDPIRVFSKADRTEQLKVRADDKLSRIRNGDTSEDAVLDLCGYMILLKIAEERA